MNMKVHQTLVWLNLLSFGTKDLAAPTIGIQSGLCHGWRGHTSYSYFVTNISGGGDLYVTNNTLLRHFVSDTQASPLPSCNWAAPYRTQVFSHCHPLTDLPCSTSAGPSFLAVPAWAHGEEPYSYPVPAHCKKSKNYMPHENASW